MELRQPIVAVLGHVDHGKTTLLDHVRGSIVAKGEAGLITQHIGASEIPIKYINKMCSTLLQKMNVDVKIPGLLFIDTPGHEAFTTLRKRGGAVSDLGVLVIDINQGIQPQTLESITFLKEFRTPFIIALTKIDMISGWRPFKGACFFETLNQQTKTAADELETKLYKIVGQLAEHGFASDRFDRVEDFTSKISLMPVSGKTGEGVPDLLMMLTGLSQKYLEDRLHITPGEGKGTVLEVKDFRGLGKTIDVILYDGEIRAGDWLAIGTKDITVTKARALMKPNPMKEIRIEKAFIPVKRVSAAAGVKIAAPEIDNVIAGSPLRSVRDKSKIEEAKRDISEEVSEVEVETENAGVLLRADTLGSLEALIKTLKDIGVPIRKASIGNVTRQDVMEVKGLEKPKIFAFNSKVSQEVEKIAEDNKVKVFTSDIIYRLIEEHDLWEKDSKKRAEDGLLDSVNRPGKVRVMPGYVFRQSKPAIVGVEVMKGTIKNGNFLRNEEGKTIGELREIQSQGENVSSARAGDKVAASIEGAIVGRNIKEDDELFVAVSEEDKKVLRKLGHRLRGDELELLEE